jgi:hypothetical protein
MAEPSESTETAELQGMVGDLRASLDEISASLDAIQRHRLEAVEASRPSVRRNLLAMVALEIISCVFVVMSAGNTVLLVLWLMIAVLASSNLGLLIVRLRVLSRHEETAKLMGKTTEPGERLARALSSLDEVLGAHPNLWPSAVPIIAAVIGAIALVATALLN